MFDRSKLWAISLLLAAFAAGIAVGGAAGVTFGERDGNRDRDARRSRPREAISYLDRLNRDLALSPTQRDSVSAILKRYDEPMRELWRRERQQVDSMRMEVRGQIAALLDEQQREQYQVMNRRVDSLRTVRERGGASRDRR
jgi:hypothetical protein